MKSEPQVAALKSVLTFSITRMLQEMVGHLKSLIAEELSSHESLFLHGLQYYKQTSKEAETKLKDDKNVSKLELQFLQQLGQFLTYPHIDFLSAIRTGFGIGGNNKQDLDAVQCKDLFEAYILNAFRGTGAQLQSILKDERSVQALLQKVWEYYFTERMMLLHCIKHLLSFHRDTEHPFQEQYLECVLNLKKAKVYDKLLQQYETSFNTPVPTRHKRGPLMSERHSIRWCLQALTEQCELLEIILLYVRDQQDPSGNLLYLAQLFQKQAFGTRQPYRHLLDAEESAHRLTARISFLCSMLLVESMNLPPLIGLAVSDKPGHSFAADEKIVEELSSIIQNLGSQPSHGPVLLAWLVLHGTLWPEVDMTGVRRLGQQAVQLQVFCYISSQLRTLSKEKKSIISLVCHVIVYNLLTLVLTLFREDTLGARDDLVRLACELLKQPQLCQEFWESDIEGGIFPLLHSSTNNFPLDFNPLLELLTPLTSEGSKQVFAFLEHLPTFTEPLDNNRSVDLQSTNQKGVWRLMQDKVLLPEGDHCQGFIIPAGSLGSQLQRNRVDLIRWSFDFSGWWLFHCLVDWLLIRTRQGSIPSGVQISQSETIINLVTHTLEADWSLSSKLQPITDCLYQLISSLTSLTNPPLGLLSVCLKCIGVLAKHQPRQVWQSIQKSGFLPHTGNVYSNATEAISGEGIYPAEYGKMLVNQEQPTGEYPVTLEVLRLLQTLLEGLCASDVDVATHQDLLACVVFVQREIFTAFHNWRYAHFDDREEVGKCSLDIFHFVLHVLPTIGKTKAAPFAAHASKKYTIVSIRETCVHGFLYTPAGEALLYIVASGIDILEQRIIDQGSTFEGAAERLSQLIKLSLSILNRLLLLKPSGQAPCPLVQALTSHTTGLPHQPHLIGLIAGYIYHRHDPRLPTLATLLLKRVAMVAPMSIFGCLGSQAAAIRDIYLSRLQAHSEDERLKVGILELLTVSVETQPGLSELFLNLEEVKSECVEQSEAEQSSRPCNPKIGKISCLHAVLDIIEEVKQGTTHCPPDLHCAALGFLQALWLDCRETALSVLRIRPKFWDDVAAPLFINLYVPEGGSQSVSSQIKIRAHAIKILALECYYVPRENLQKHLKTVLKKLKQEDRYTYWSKCIHTLLESAAGQKTDSEEYLIRQHELLVLIQAWRTLLLVSTSPHGKAMELSDTKIQSLILSDIAASIHCQSHQFDSVLNQKACSLLSSLYVSLLMRWTNIQFSQWKHMDSLVAVLERIMDSDSPGRSSTATSIMTALTALLKQRTSKQACAGSIIMLNSGLSDLIFECSARKDVRQSEPTKLRKGHLEQSVNLVEHLYRLQSYTSTLKCFRYRFCSRENLCETGSNWTSKRLKLSWQDDTTMSPAQLSVSQVSSTTTSVISYGNTADGNTTFQPVFSQRSILPQSQRHIVYPSITAILSSMMNLMPGANDITNCFIIRVGTESSRQVVFVDLALILTTSSMVTGSNVVKLTETLEGGSQGSAVAASFLVPVDSRTVWILCTKKTLNLFARSKSQELDALHVETIESLLPIIYVALQYSSHFYIKLPSTANPSIPPIGGYAQGSDSGTGLEYGQGTVQRSVTTSGLSSTTTALTDDSGRPVATSSNGMQHIDKEVTGSMSVSKYSAMVTKSAFCAICHAIEKSMETFVRTKGWTHKTHENSLLQTLNKVTSEHYDLYKFVGCFFTNKQMPTIAAYLLDELLVGEKLRVSVWLPLLKQHGMLNLLLTTLQSCIQVQQGLYYTEAVLLLLLDLASIPQAAESMQTSSLIQQTCLPLLQLHQQNGEAMLTWSNMAKIKKTDTITWLSIYRHSISVVTVMFGTLQHSFLPDALDFFGVHRERMMQCLDAVRYNQSQACLMEAETTSAFIYQLSHFAKDLGSRMRTGEVQGLLLCVTSLCHCCVALLIRPKLLQYLTETNTKHTDMNKKQLMVLTTNGTPIMLRQQTSTTDLAENKFNPEVQHIQARLLVILGHGLAALRHFSPDLLTILLNPSVDILEYQMLLGLGFSTPTLEADIEPSFGLLISCINTCVQLLSKLDCNKTSPFPDETAPTILPVIGPSMPAQHRYMDRPLIMFILETSVELLMVQGLRCLKDPTLPVRDRQIVKRELGTELATFLQSLQRYFRRGGGPSSPSSASPSSSTSLLRTPSTSILSKSSSHTSFSQAPEQVFFRVVQHFMQQILR